MTDKSPANKLRYYIVIFYILSIGSLYAINEQNQIYNNYYKTSLAKLKESRNNSDYESALYYCNLLDLLSAELNDKELILKSKVTRFYTYRKFMKRDLALETALTIYELNKQLEGFKKCTSFYSIVSYLSQFMLDIGNHTKSLEYLHDYKKSSCYQNFASHNDLDYKIAQILITTNQPDSAKQIMTSYLAKVKSARDTIALISALNQSGLIFRQLNDYKSSITFYNKAIELIELTNYKNALKPVILGNIGDCYFELKNMILLHIF